MVAAGLVLAAVLVLGGRLSDPFGQGEGHGASSSGGALLAGLFGQSESYKAPPGQPPATDLKVDRLREAFNSAAREPRIVLSLSPT